MSEKKKKKKNSKILVIISIIFCFLIGFFVGYMMMEKMDSGAISSKFSSNLILDLVINLAVLYLAMFLQLALHEGGHLIFGLLTGYEFFSYRLGSFVWVKDNEGKIHLRKYKLSGTSGQCILTPPPFDDGRMPYKLYNAGGCLVNLLTIPLFYMIHLLAKDIFYLDIFCIFMMTIGFVFALTNGIPLKLGQVNNDGRNLLDLGKDKDALYSFWLQLYTTEQQQKGIRYKDMEDKYFYIPDTSKWNNPMITVLPAAASSRLIDLHEFSKAKEIIEPLVDGDYEVIGVIRNLMICDLITILILENDYEKAKSYYTKDIQKFMKQMKSNPSVLRMGYAYQKWVIGSEDGAKQIKALFEKMAKTYPYPSDIEAERELFAIIDNKEEKTDEAAV